APPDARRPQLSRKPSATTIDSSTGRRARQDSNVMTNSIRFRDEGEKLSSVFLRSFYGVGRVETRLKVFVRQGLTLTAGLCLGIAGALFLSRWLSSLLFGVTPPDPF